LVLARIIEPASKWFAPEFLEAAEPGRMRSEVP
jgi:hypothetical protein